MVVRYALLVGTNEGGDDRVALRYAHDDARAMGQVLTTIGGVLPEHERLLLDPSAAEVAAAFDALKAEIAGSEGRSEVVFYYSGHSDEEGLLLGAERFGYADLRAALEGLDAMVRVAILDSCASGALILAKGGRSVPPFLADGGADVDGFAYITSSSADEVAQEGERIGGSYFTHYLETGLRGAADLSHDGRVTLTEAYSFAYDETLARTERTQHGPQHATYQIELTGTGDLVLTDLSVRPSGVVLDESVDGRVAVRDARGDLVAELVKAPGRRTELAVAEGAYEVTLTPATARFGLAEVEVTAGTEVVVSADLFDWYDAEDTLVRGGAPVAVVSNETRRDVELPRFVGWSTEAPPGTDQLVLGLLAARSSELHGAGGALGWYRVDGRAGAFVGALGGTRVGRLEGIQSGLVWNQADDASGGLQLAWFGANWTGGGAGRGFDGLQLAGAFNHAEGGVRGAQLAVGFNHARYGFDGLQGAVGVNVARGPSDGAQLGSVNVAGDVNGAQVGFVNVGGKVDGLQLGLVNVARDSAVPIGLLSFVREGRHDLLLSASETDTVNAEVKLGGRYLHNLVGFGWHPDHGYAAAGAGAHAPFLEDRLWVDLDLLGAAYVPLVETTYPSGDVRGPWLDEAPTYVVRGRATFGVQLARPIALFAGVQETVRVPVEDVPALDLAPDALATRTGEVVSWPGLFGGVSVRIGAWRERPAESGA